MFADLLRAFGGNADRGPGCRPCGGCRCGQAALAVELCQRVAEIAGQELPGSYRPGAWAAGAGRR
jgi:hypothetical protein